MTDKWWMKLRRKISKCFSFSQNRVILTNGWHILHLISPRAEGYIILSLRSSPFVLDSLQLTLVSEESPETHFLLLWRFIGRQLDAPSTPVNRHLNCGRIFKIAPFLESIAMQSKGERGGVQWLTHDCGFRVVRFEMLRLFPLEYFPGDVVWETEILAYV
jgi:hypothetical protein